MTADYQNALREVPQREGEVVRLVTTIQKAAAALERWQAVYRRHSGRRGPTPTRGSASLSLVAGQ
jgi:hypothetical protein